MEKYPSALAVRQLAAIMAEPSHPELIRVRAATVLLRMGDPA
jgi:hypothetical protein